MPDNYSPDLRVFPAKEMMAVDMAYALDALALGNGIIHGCQVANTNGALTITSGRIMIKGRLAYIHGGNIPLPSDSGTYHLLAICNLQAPEPFELRLCSDTEKADLDALVANTSDADFNNADGVRYLELGTAAVDVTLGVVTTYTPSTGSNIQTNSSLIATIEGGITHRLDDHASYLALLNRSKWGRNKFSTRSVTYPFVRVAAGSREGVTINLAYGANYTATISSGMVSVHETPGTDTPPANVTDEFGRRTTVDERHKVLGIVGINFSNADDQFSGSGATKCVVAGWNQNSQATDDQHHPGYVYVYNTGTTAAFIKVGVRVLYAQFQ